jgi:hypothetical protein
MSRMMVGGRSSIPQSPIEKIRSIFKEVLTLLMDCGEGKGFDDQIISAFLVEGD